MVQAAETGTRTASEQLRVRGLVQGVGFRPTVYRLAREQGLVGEVRNDGDGVLITLQAEPQRITRFIDSLRHQCPPLARIDAIQQQPLYEDFIYRDFSIVESHYSEVHTVIVADAATCDACLDDLFDTGNRRHGYAFTNCTHCGPRLSIVNAVPYDRAHTSMVDFELCDACADEYSDPADRRFHAQPNACLDCGPRLSLCDRDGREIGATAAIASSARLLSEGFILAIKGIGGFQIACDARNQAAVAELRRRKQRPHKSLALLARDIGQVEEYCRLDAQELQILQSNSAPILILRRSQASSVLAGAIAPAQNTYGFMLPYSPLHHLLMRELEAPIVLTSGNTADEPQCTDNQQALDRLGAIADYFLMHDRDIVNRVDDSVSRVIAGQVSLHRRARGYAPAPLTLPLEFSQGGSILAAGGEMKNTFCLLKDGQAILSQHLGNLSNRLAFDDYIENLKLYRCLFQFSADAIAVDRHPEYLSSKHGMHLAQEGQLPLVTVQHHHAHIAACLADNGWESSRGKVIGVALDGVGFGDDDSVWGGEFLLADYRGYRRLGRFKPVPMIGANKASLEPWRNTYAQLQTHLCWQQLEQENPRLDLVDYLAGKPLGLIDQMMQNQLNSPLTSSCGRLFDAVAAALDLCRDQISYEGQAAIELEALVDANGLAKLPAYPFTLERGTLLEINPAPMWSALLDDIRQARPKSFIAGRFHLGLAQAIVDLVNELAAETGISTVALSGGVFQNASLLQLVTGGLSQTGLQTLVHRQVPSNDGGLALGQAVVAAARLDVGEAE